MNNRNRAIAVNKLNNMKNWLLADIDDYFWIIIMKLGQKDHFTMRMWFLFINNKYLAASIFIGIGLSLTFMFHTFVNTSIHSPSITYRICLNATPGFYFSLLVFGWGFIQIWPTWGCIWGGVLLINSQQKKIVFQSNSCCSLKLFNFLLI